MSQSSKEPSSRIRSVGLGGDGGDGNDASDAALPGVRAGRGRSSALGEDSSPAGAAVSSGALIGGPGVGALPAEGGRRSSYRATSGSEVGLELDPQAAKVVEVYGFAGWIATFVGWSAYIVWAYLPESVMRAAGVTYYPNKYWASAAPALLVSLVCVYGLLYGAVGLLNNPHVTAWATLSDGHSKPLLPPQGPAPAAARSRAGTEAAAEGGAGAAAAAPAQDWRFMSTPEISDLPLTLINRLQFMS